MHHELWTFLNREIARAQSSPSRSGKYLIGVEHEFFLIADDGLPSTFEGSQAFLREFANRIHAKTYFSQNGSISKLGFDKAEGSYGSFKYDHEPHLLEYASSFHNNLRGLEAELRSIFLMAEEVSKNLGFSVVHMPTISVDPKHPRTQRDTQEYKDLRWFREQVQTKLGLTRSSEGANYAAVIASTQVNVSIRSALWNENPKFIPNLYSYEQKILPFSTMFSGPDSRWNRYLSSYKGYKLLGFPDVTPWNYENWLNECLNSYVFEHGVSSVRTLGDILSSNSSSPEKFWKALRDLQIIRPKATGAVEFRADPAQPGVSYIMALAALRLGTCLLTSDKTTAIGSEEFQSFRNEWWRSVKSMSYGKPSREFIETVLKRLEAENAGEERYLKPYLERARSDAA